MFIYLFSANNSRASTPLSQKSIGSRRGRPPKKHGINRPENKPKPESKSIYKPKKFRMVLEKDDDYEVDYLTPEEVYNFDSFFFESCSHCQFFCAFCCY